MVESRNRFQVNLGWLLKLRWVAIIGQLATIAFARWALSIQLLLWPLLVIIGLTLLSNLVLAYWYLQDRRLPVEESDATADGTQTPLLGLVMTMDMLSLTTLLYVTGGPTNPFFLFYFVNASLGGILLDRNWAWALNLLSIACFTGLLFRYVPVPEFGLAQVLTPPSLSGQFSLVHLGLLAGFATCSSVIVYFMTRLTGELRQQELDLRLAQQQKSRSEKLEALGTLAAGAAHELATPLSTIAVVAKDVETMLRRAETGGDPIDGSLVDDVGEIRQELDRCKRILDRMSGQAGEPVGEMIEWLSLEELAQEICEGLEVNQARIRTTISDRKSKTRVRVPRVALSQAVRALVQNGLDASPEDQPVELRLDVLANELTISVIDRGLGMPPDVLDRVSEPFFTTKQPGKGMGLGVYLAKNVIERIGGTLAFESQSTGRGSGSSATGTHAFVRIPQND